MAELSELNSWNTSPTRFIAIIDGAESGLIDTDAHLPDRFELRHDDIQHGDERRSSRG